MDNNLFDRYLTEAQDDLDIDDLTIHEKQLRLPSQKHKWVGRLIRHKIERDNLKKQREDLIDYFVHEGRQSSVQISAKGLRQLAERDDKVNTINQEIKYLDNLIEYLERLEKVFSQTTFDIKNIIDIKKLELQ